MIVRVLFPSLALLTAAGPALGLTSCPIRVEPPAAELDWREEAARIGVKIGTLPEAERDCRDILVRVEAAGARVVLTTEDERRAVRPVRDPGELEAVISALVVTVPAAERIDVPAPLASTEPKRDTPGQWPTVSAAPGQHVLALTLLGGGRAGLGEQMASPSLSAQITARVPWLETGVYAQHEFGYRMLAGSAPDGFTLRATSVGALAGYRHRLGSRTLLIGGARVGAAFVREQVVRSDNDVVVVGEDDSEDSDVPVIESYSPIEARVAGYIGVLVLATSRFGFRSELALEGVPVRWNDTRAKDSELPLLPNWAAGIHLGIEGGLL